MLGQRCPRCQGSGYVELHYVHKIGKGGVLDAGRMETRLCPRCGGCGADTYGAKMDCGDTRDMRDSILGGV